MEVKNNKILGLFFLAEFLTQFIFFSFSLQCREKGKKNEECKNFS